MKLRYTPEAMADLLEIEDYITNTLLAPEAARNVLGKIATSCGKLKNQPYMGVELRRKIGRDVDGYCLISGTYMVIYYVDDEAVSVIRVLDTRTDYLRAIL